MRSTHVHSHAYARTRQHVDEGVDAEQLDLAAHEVANPRLRHAEQLCCRGLRELPSLDQPLDLDHQVRPDPEARTLLRPKAEVAEHVPGRPLHSYPSHECLPLARAGLPAPPVPQDIAESFPGEVYVLSCRLSGLLLEGVQNVDPFVKLCQVDHPVFSFRVDPYLSNRGADRRHRLPVCSIEALLDSVDLVPCSPSGILRKRPHISSGRPHPDDHLQHPSRLYNILYNPVKPPNPALQPRRWASLATRHQPLQEQESTMTVHLDHL